MKLNKTKEKQVAKLYLLGLSSMKISRILNCSDTTVLNVLKRNNIKRRNASEAAYKGSKFKDKKGYVRVTPVGKDKLLNTSKYRFMLEHRLIMSKHLGRKLYKHETVHHINGDRTDNRIENLELWSTSQPYGQRVKDKISLAKQLLKKYGYKIYKK